MSQRPRKLRFGSTRHSLCRMLTVVAYTLATVGVPLGGSFGEATSECRCSDDLRASGQCCSQNKLANLENPPENKGRRAAAPRRPCCGTKSEPASGSLSGSGNGCCSTNRVPTRRVDTTACCPSEAKRRCDSSGAQNAVSCCQERTESQPDAESPLHPAVTACTCAGQPAPGIACNTDPRLTGDGTEIPRDHAWQPKRQPSSPVAPERTASPETPPPKVPTA